ncbi:invasion associated locus B family protein [Pseudooceanicola onchidii]|uniref:invasion associated locus B family protein n=1 Tax=Pseudooceanicola onchidii TaxID=2562279 RepID=UPI00145A10EB|nr:invasion associated locus B family protein [Pseudooceanicola onchidii]
MLKTRPLLSALALAAMTGAAMAQTATTEAPAAEATETTQTEQSQTEQAQTTPAVDSTLDTGQSEEPQVGQGYVRESFGDWQLQCIKEEDATKERCQLYQLLLGEQGNPVAEVLIEKLPDGGQVAAGATVAVPHGTALAKDLRITVDGAKGKVYRYAFCDAASCYARIGLLAADVSAFQRGNSAKVTIFPFESQDTPVDLTLSLSGFTAGYEATTAPAAPAE